MIKSEKWYKNPNTSDVWEDNIDYVMFVDENNSVSAINKVKEKLFNNEEISPNENIFTVTGCIFSRISYNNAKIKFNNIRNKFWNNGKFYNPSPNHECFETVCFHSEDIRGRKKAFHIEALQQNQYEKFIFELDKNLKEFDYKIISININLCKYILNSKYTEMNVYKIAFNFIIERLIYYIGSKNTASIIFESRGTKENKNLLEHIDKIINKTGTEFINSYELSKKIKGVYFNTKKNKDGNPYVGLEIADLSSYPIHRYVKFGTRGRDFETLKTKIIGYPDGYGKGLKIYPKK